MIGMELRNYLIRQLSHTWSIGVYSGPSPTMLMPHQGVLNPVLTGADVSDRHADCVADPFMLHRGDSWHLFFEVLQFRGKGEIGVASSADGLHWTYRQIVLSEPFHLSYPYVFEWQGEYYMLPECSKARSVLLYKATDFPTQWIRIGTFIEGVSCTDSSIFRYRDTWWLFTATDRSETLRLYYAETLLGAWKEHPSSPIVQGDRHRARPAGRVVVMSDRVIRYSQDCYPHYGLQVNAYEVTTLTRDAYEERPAVHVPVLSRSGQGWNACGMHHVDAHELKNGLWRACVDGWTIQAPWRAAMLASIRVARDIEAGLRKRRVLAQS
jgi:hypothetical protein